MNQTTTHTPTHSDILTEVRGGVGFITLNRPKALNALSLSMVRDLTAALTAWQGDAAVVAVAIRGTNKAGRPGTPESLFGGFCAGGDIRFFHQAALAGDSDLDAFFTEEYRLNHLIHNYPKPYIAFMDGVVMGGGMGISVGARVRIVTEHTKMAMPETNIGLFPDVGGGYFLSRCPGSVGEYLALTGVVIGAGEALAYGLADIERPAASLPGLWQQLGDQAFSDVSAAEQWIATNFVAGGARPERAESRFDACFSLARVKHIVDALEAAKDDDWAQKTAVVLRKRSPLMLHVTLEQIRRARSMSLADDLRMERDMVHHCFHLRPGAASETVEGIRALAVDKDYTPKWNPAHIEDVKPQMVQAFFASPWAAEAHPLRDLQ
ncbi:enoyl-CoA hydratase/isomerase family protein [Polaromonas sp.]|uniref:enoyl-CoA hydratase/isomerase family protein n=1 Tax=Polaromonas sp. TaxID=1869339 RepID=UPI002488EC27|nr:enoyl-CoA hydratase/isomerase family protein [Polaromonas sp.]MDI1273967.1 enoyl-CoA hydratase/isomerase family protein [Polaromonas sp.]MDI1275499.1 enoyl-CoA hydratase/isomerase family protein [Polaromonas sp.]